MSRSGSQLLGEFIAAEIFHRLTRLPPIEMVGFHAEGWLAVGDLLSGWPRW